MSRKLLLTLLMLTASIALFSQSGKVPELFKNMRMRSIGPAVMSGRVTAIDVVEENENIIYVGTASGGLWKSESGGVNWLPVFDEQEVIGIGAICIDPSASDVIWAGTGEGNPRNSQTNGAGIYRSPDGGRSWKNMGLTNTETIHRIIVDPQNSQVVYTAAHGNAWQPGPDRGVYKTTNSGTSWEKILFLNDTTGCADLVMDPNNSSKLFAAMYQYHRKPHHFTSGGQGSGLHLTVDGGKTWNKLDKKNGLPEGEYGRIGLAIAPGDSRIIYALIECKSTGLYKSTDGGYNWRLINDKDVDDRPFYYHEMYVDPSDENHLIYLHSVVSESIDGGQTWTTLLPYSGVHPDHHAFWWSKKNPRLMFEGNDGGLNFSRDGGNTWVFINNLPLGQFYHINYDMDTPYHIYGGMQDNGSWKGSSYVWHSDGIGASDWQEILFGDGFDVVPKKDDSRYAYAMSQGGEVYYIDTETGDMRCVKPTHPEGLKLRFHWNSGIADDPFNPCGIYFGSQFLHYSQDCGLSWKILSPDLTTNDTLKQKQNESGGLTPDQTSAENHCTILCIAPSALNKDVVWIGTDDGNVQITTNGGNSWTNCSTSIAGLPIGAWVPQIVAGLHNVGEAFVVVNNYRQGDSKPYLFHTTDYGKTWKNLTPVNSVNGHTLSVIQDHVEPSLLFLGTEHGLYVSFDKGTNWNHWTFDYPNVATQDLKIHPRENDLIIGTFGRAIYILDDINPLRQFASTKGNHFKHKLTALHTPVSYLAAYSQPKGERFPGDLHFRGENRSYGATLGYYFEIEEEKTTDVLVEKNNNKSEKKSKISSAEKKSDVDSKSSSDKTGKKEKKVRVSIMTLEGDTIRTFKHEPDTGLNYLSWYFDSKGVRTPSRKDQREEADEPGGGPAVKPGTYKVVYSYKDIKDSTLFEVRFDPRLTWDEKSFDKSTELTLRLNKSIQKASDAMSELRNATKTIELVKTAFVNVPDSVKKQILSDADSLKNKIDELILIVFIKEGTSGIVDDSDKLNSKIWNARAYLGSVPVGTNAEIAIGYAETEIQKFVDKVNSLFESDWLKWKADVEKVQYSLFKEVKKI